MSEHKLPVVDSKQKDKSGSRLSIASSHHRSGSHSSTSAAAASIVTVPPAVNVALQYAMNGDLDDLVQCFEDETDPNHESIGVQISQRSPEDGRSPLDWAALLGRIDIVAELVKRGVDVNAVNEKGYTAAHLAAAWDKVQCLRMLVDSGANMELQNIYEETPRDIAKRYMKWPCVEYFSWADAKKAFRESVMTVKEQLAAADKLKTLTKEEKTGINSMVNEQIAWLDKTTDETPVEDFVSHKNTFEDCALPIMNKLAVSESDSKRPRSQKKQVK